MISEIIRNKRENLGLTQADLGKKLKYHGQFISDWERGVSTPPVKALKKLIKVLGADKDAIISALLADYRNNLEGHLK
jgi:transcriptional regulator with XRE-family HTH domain